MRILWITGSLLPEAIAKIKGEPIEQWKATGSWIIGAASKLTSQECVQLYMLSTSQLVKDLTCVTTGKIVSYAIPYGKGHFKKNSAYNKYMRFIWDKIRPDIIHIHGTEYSHSYAFLQECGNSHTVISIQGMTSVCSRYFREGITTGEILRNISFRDIIRGGILHEQAAFRKRGDYEKAMIKSVRHVIGRTSWDEAQVKAINPDVTYHYLNETLRPEFYTGEHWEYATCHPHTIFMSQGTYPYKGLHQVLKAFPLILKKYPDCHIRIAGSDPTINFDTSQWWRITGYGRYLKSLICKYHIREHVTFIGPKDAAEMKKELLHCNLFLIPSAIENSPNSLGEAQILGVPCIASYVGGVMDMMKGNEGNMYRYEEIEMLAHKICQVFYNEADQIDCSQMAAQRHDPSTNVKGLIEIYNNIINHDH